jgi:hypothetical protein
MQMNENIAAGILSENCGCVKNTQFYCSPVLNSLQAGHFASAIPGQSASLRLFACGHWIASAHDGVTTETTTISHLR